MNTQAKGIKYERKKSDCSTHMKNWVAGIANNKL